MEGKNSYALSKEVIEGIKPFAIEKESAGERIVRDGMAVQRVQAPYTTAVAVQKPRSISRVTANVLEEAKLAGSSFYYGWTAKKKDGGTEKIEGPSIDLAMCMARNYGNCALDIEEDETLDHYRFKGVFIDLESGFTCPRLFRQRKSQNIGMKDQGRAEDIVYQIGQSKAVRNCIVRAMPTWLSDQAIDEAKKAELSRIKPENIALARGKTLEFFRQYGVTQERIEAKIGSAIDTWTPQNIVDLRGMATALKEGRISAIELFPEVTTEKTEVTEKRTTKAKAKPKEAEVVVGQQEQEKKKAPPVDEEMAPSECPDRPGDIMTKEYCDKCVNRLGCPAWE